jgi:hypothetical protein
MKTFDRRTLLRGTIAGGVVSVGLPLLDIFLNNNGTALAQGQPLPVRFGVWFWGLGMNAQRWVPSTVGDGYDLPVELAALDRTLPDGSALKDHVSILSGFDVKLDGRPNHPHSAGWIGTTAGSPPDDPGVLRGPTLDSLIASQVGGVTRFRSLELAAHGEPGRAYSYASPDTPNTPEVSPLALYERVFGPEFADPNDANFTPDPRLMLRQSVLSSVKNDRDRLVNVVGSHDKQRLEEYFTSVRQLEQQLGVLLSGPPDLEACAKAPVPESEDIGHEVEQSVSTNKLMAEILTFALACDQTRVFSMMFSHPASRLRKPGANISHHQLTHDELVDSVLGYQPEAGEFVIASMEAWADFTETLAAFPEGDGTLLDNCLVWAHSDSSDAKQHSILGLPMMVAGRGGGRIRAGVHVPGAAGPTSRVGLTMQQVMGVNIESWGTQSMQTQQPISEILL